MPKLMNNVNLNYHKSNSRNHKLPTHKWETEEVV